MTGKPISKHLSSVLNVSYKSRTVNSMTITKRKGFWIRDTPGGDIEFSTISKVLFSILPFPIAALFYKLLVMIEDLKSGPEIIITLAYGIILLMAALVLLVIIVAIIDYLRRFEQ